MEEYIKYIIIIAVILVLDAIWIASNFKMYSDAVRAVQKSPMVVRYHYAAFTYVIMIFASLYVAIPFTMLHISARDDVMTKLYKAFIYGGAVGFVANGIYNFTCVSIYKDYEFKVAAMDTMWGIIINAIAAFVYTLL
jgi:uncharacterized membrane protein